MPGPASSLPRASVRETVAVAAGVLAPMLAQGVIVRRPAVTALADRLQVDRRAAGILRRLRDRHGPGPVLLRIPGRDLAVVLDPGDVERLLAGAPRPFTPANREKRAALRHFQPYGVLISDDAGRSVRRPWNEEVLDHGAGLHRLHEHLVRVVAEEVAELAGEEAGSTAGEARSAAGRAGSAAGPAGSTAGGPARSRARS
ncbi:hypothetical protein [Georgenia sp. SUBG003]|uniref:hypothetical protein n=1 Tax=Georgenia sp. SUBG003 TaxID=1497974 RepID=UPI0004D5EA45|nr:hypothetical protein DA06_10295 [Georgenia sp. SUBG003]